MGNRAERKRPTKAEKIENYEEAVRRLADIKASCDRVKQWSPVHWTAFFTNGRRLEIYPATLSLHLTGHWLKQLPVDEMITEMTQFAALPPRDPDHDWTEAENVGSPA